MNARGFTLARPAAVHGVGLFSEAECTVRILPAAGSITFQRRSATARASIDALSARPAHAAFENMPPRSTNLALPDGSAILTVEHLLSALVGLHVHGAVIEIDGPEVPIGDGSARAFIDAMQSAGLEPSTDRSAAPLLEAFTVGVPDGPHIIISPAERLEMFYHLDYGPDSPIRPQSASWDGTPGAYAREIAPARTYCLDYEAHAMRGAGLFNRFTPADFLVIGREGPIDNTLRFGNEPARHKLLDLIGDLALAGLPLPNMRVEAFGSGHALNHEAARRLRRLDLIRDTVTP